MKASDLLNMYVHASKTTKAMTELQIEHSKSLNGHHLNFCSPI